MEAPVEAKRRYTVEEYLRLEETSDVKHEYRFGEIVDMSGILDMSGGMLDHSLVSANVSREMGNALKGGPCRVFDSNLRVRINRNPLFCYPDVTVICGEPVFDPGQPEKRLTVLNPKLIVEVLSPSTAGYDRGEKFTRYRELESLEEYMLVTADKAQVEVYFRQADGTWLFSPTAGLEGVARLRSLDVRLPLAEVYAGLTFPEAAEPALDESDPPATE
jgi:Uma2 family endonuclease